MDLSERNKFAWTRGRLTAPILTLELVLSIWDFSSNAITSHAWITHKKPY